MQSLQNTDKEPKAAVKIGSELGEWFNISIGTKQGDPASPSHFIAYLERVMMGFGTMERELLLKRNESAS